MSSYIPNAPPHTIHAGHPMDDNSTLTSHPRPHQHPPQAYHNFYMGRNPITPKTPFVTYKKSESTDEVSESSSITQVTNTKSFRNLHIPDEKSKNTMSENVNDESEDESDYVESDDDSKAENFTGLHKLCSIAEGEDDPLWEDIMTNLKSYSSKSELKSAVTTEQKGVIPIFIACEQQPPVKVIKALIDASPSTLGFLDEQDFLPLHTACSNDASEHVIQMLVKRDPNPQKAREALTNAKTTPLHLLMYENNSKPPSVSLFQTLATSFVMEAEDQFGNTPLSLIIQYIQRSSLLSDREVRCAKQHCIDILDAYLDMEPILMETDLLEEMVHFPSWLRDHLLQHTYTQHLLNTRFSQQPFPTSFLMLDFSNQIMIIAAFMEAIGSGLTNANAQLNPNIILISIGIAYILTRIACQLPFSSHPNSFWILGTWNWISIIQIIFLILSILRFQSKDSFISRSDQVILTVTGGITWIMLISLLRTAYLPFSIFVSTIIHLVYILVPFIITIFCILGAFTTMFFTVLHTSNEGLNWCTEQIASDEEFAEISYCSLNGSFFKLYNRLVDSDFEELGFMMEQTRILSPLFSFMVVILFFNVLIAIVNHSYSDMEYRGKMAFWRSRLHFVMDTESFWNCLCCSYTDPKLIGNPLDIDDYSRHSKSGVWDVLAFSLAPRQDREKFLKKEHLLAECNNPLYVKLLNRSLLMRRMIAIFVLPLWFIFGIISLGVLWPPQVRKWLFCPNLNTHERHSINDKQKRINFDNVLKDDVKRVCHRVQNLESEINDVKQDISNMKKDIMKEMNSIKQLLAALNRSPPPSEYSYPRYYNS